MYFVKTALSVLCATLMWTALPAHSSEVPGVRYQTILLLKITDMDQYQRYHNQAVQYIERVGCAIDREIDLNKPPRGSLDVGDPNRVISMYCDSPNGLAKLSRIPEYLKLVPLRQMSTDGDPIVVAGKNIFFGEASQSPLDNRLYVIKITTYKPDQEFHNDLASIDAQLDPMGFHREKMIYIDTARGMDLPSTVGVMFYDDPSQQKELFGNQKLVESIGTFNKNYTDGYVYLEGTVPTR